MTAFAAPSTATAACSLVAPELFERLVTRIVEDESLDRSYAERIMCQALVFLVACANNPTTPLSPSRAVDIGWHTFILHTLDYAEFCQRVAGRFIHHNPTRGGDVRSGTTLEAVQQTGYPVDMPLWMVEDAADCDKCSQCHAGCHDSP